MHTRNRRKDRNLFQGPGAAYSLLFTSRADDEDGGGSQYSQHMVSGTLRLIGAPPFFAFSPDLLLMPQEVVS
jgi:hypothetical protein